MGVREVGTGYKPGDRFAPADQMDVMKNTTSRILYTYWNEVRGRRPAPHRFEIEPARIAAILPDAFILERVDNQTYRFRIAGTRLCEQFGKELRGTNFLDQWDSEDRFILKQRLLSISEQASVGLFEYEAFGCGSDTAVQFEMLVVPLMQKDSVINRFLGVVSPCAGDWCLGLEDLTRRQLLRHETFWPEGVLPLMSNFNRRPLPDMRSARLVRINQRSFRVYEGGLSRRSSEKG